MSTDESKTDKRRSSTQGKSKTLSLKEIEEKLLEKDISTIELLIDELKGPDEKTVTRIKRLLVKHGQYAIDHYIKTLKTSNDQIYENIVDVLLELGDFSVAPLIQALDDPSEEIKNSVKSILIQIGKPTVTPLIKELENPSEEIKNSVKSILIQIGKPTVTPLIQALENPNEEIRNSSKNILMSIGKPAVDPLVELLLIAKPATKHHIREILINIGEPVIKPLMNTLKEPHLSQTATKEIEMIILDIGESGVRSLIRGLKEPDPTIRENVEKMLLEIGEASTPLLLNVAKDKDKDVASLAKNILRKMGQTGIKPLIETIQTKRESTEKITKLIDSINLLGEISSSEEIQAFLSNLNSISELETNKKSTSQIISQSLNVLRSLLNYNEDIEVQRCAIHALGEIGEPFILDSLISLLDSSSWQIRADARDVISHLKINKSLSEAEKKELFLKKFPDFQQYPLIEDILNKYKEGNISSHDLLKEIGRTLEISEEEVLYHFNGMFLDKDLIIEKLMKIIQDPPKPQIKISEAKKQQIIEKYPDFQQFNNLEEAFHQYEIDNYSYEQLIKKLIDLFNIPEEEEFFFFLNEIFPELNYIKENLILIFSKFKDERVIEYLLGMAEDINPRIRWIATWALRNNINEKVIGFFAERIKNSSYEKHVRWMSVIGLRKVQDTKTIDALLEGVKDSDDNISRWSSYALSNIGNPVIIPLIDALEEVADTESAYNIKKTLVKFKKEAVKHLIKRLEARNEILFEHIGDILLEIGKPAIRPLINSLNHSDKKIVEDIMKILTRFGIDASIPLIKALGDTDEKIQLNAMRILYNLGDEAIQPLIGALERKDKEITENAMKILYKMGDASIPSLIDTLEGSSTNLKRIVITLLSEMSPKSIQPLIIALDESKEKVENAKIALSKIGENEIAKELLSISNGKEFSIMHKILEGEKEFRDLAFRIKRLRERAKRKKIDENNKETD